MKSFIFFVTLLFIGCAPLSEKDSPIYNTAYRPVMPWPYGIIFYDFHEDLSDSHRWNMEAAARKWEEKTGLIFVPMVPDSDIHDYVLIQPSDECNSLVGYWGGVQTLNMAPGCGYIAALHEWGHVIGLSHEHQRVDRDDYVEINWLNIKVGAMSNFQRLRAAYHPNKGPYDYYSIMHYDSYAFARRPTSHTITGFLVENEDGYIPYNRRITELDADKVRAFYQYEIQRRITWD